MKQYIAILLFLGMIVAISGCTSETSNKTYSANGVNFTYPGNASEMNSTSLQAQVGSTGTMIAMVGDNSTFLFGVAKVNIQSNQRLASLSEWATSYNNTLKASNETYISEKNMTVDGVNGIMITSNDSSFFYREVFFIKNNTGYLAILLTKNNDEQLFNDLVSSLRINQ
ncbi:MAG: hypothetical protein LUQ24_07470 [Methanobacterium sp.]|nr:hypothetical protein [Methanobacterium sp.]